MKNDTFLREITDSILDEETFLKPIVFEKLLKFKKEFNIDKIEMYQRSGAIIMFYIYPLVSDDIIDKLSDELDDVVESNYDPDTVYCAFATNHHLK